MSTLAKTVPATGITVYTDKNGVTREYREVKRKAAVGELVKDTGSTAIGEIHYVTYSDEVGINGHTTGITEARTCHSNYVVLEPTDIIHHDGKRWREVKRKAEKGELVIIGEHRGGTSHCHKIGQIGVAGITEAGDTRITIDGYEQWVPFSGYTVLEPVYQSQQVTVPAGPSLEDRISQLEQRVAALEAKLVQEKQDGKGSTVRMKTMPLQRDTVIELAKKDVEELVSIGEDSWASIDSASPVSNEYYLVKFIVNRKKRTVVALVRPRNTDVFDFDYVTEVLRGIAHCAPDDCFNVHIGKAIALRRALGLNVPDYYINAPKPTEAQVGDIVYLHKVGCSVPLKNKIMVDAHLHQVRLGIAHTVDDSHDFGGEQQ